MSRFRLPIWSPRLLWKLAASYLFITLAVVIVYIFIDVEVEYHSFQSQLHASWVAARMEQEGPRFTPLLDRSAPNLPALEHLLFRLQRELESRYTGLGHSYYFSLEEFQPAALSLTLLDQYGQALARTGAKPEGTGAFSISMSSARQILRDEQNVKLIAVPLRNVQGELQYVLLTHLQLPNRWWQGVPFASIVGELRSVDLLFMALMALTFGYVIARQLTRRLERISTAAEAWGRGDFTAVAEDNSADEIGELSRRLNRMAEELREVVALRQNLAASEERNRLARDLHDTVKQRAFALSLQIGATQALIETAPNAAQTRLAEAEKLAHQIQQELVTLIEELRPQPANGLVSSFRETLNDWSRQNNIQTDLRINAAPTLSANAQAELLRILHEALSNIARHSGAQHVTVQIDAADNQHISLLIQDDGRGFDAARQNGGMGLRNMRERAEALPQGQFTLTSSPAAGTCLHIRCAKAA